jgi:PAS domain S-box-containing protein/putative nucleotidyltransferase with HDIG domain
MSRTGDEPAQVAEEPMADRAGVLQTLRILLLEDDSTDAQLIEDQLQRGGILFASTRVCTREGFIRALDERALDLILADYKLPAFDGIAALAIAREKCPEVPFILVSGEISEEMALEAVHGGATDYVFKDGLLRLVPSVHRAMHEVEERAQRCRAQEALRASEQRYRLLVEHSHDAIFQLDREGRVIFANPAARTLFGYAPEEFVADPSLFERIIQPWSGTRYQDVRDEFRKQGMLTEGSQEWAWAHRDGTTIFTENTFTNLVGDEGRVLGYQLIARDVTGQKRVEYELRHSYEKLRRLFGQTVRSLAQAVEKRDPFTGGHQHRVAQLAQRIAQDMALPPDQVEGILLTGLLHDIGKINIPAEILTKPGRLSDVELMIIRTHPQVGYDILKSVEFPWPVAPTVLQHHERLDGSGYPAGLTGDQILLEAKILGVADVVEGMASHRPYRPAHGVDRALLELLKHRGVRFETAVVDACLAIFAHGGFEFEPESHTAT